MNKIDMSVRDCLEAGEYKPAYMTVEGRLVDLFEYVTVLAQNNLEQAKSDVERAEACRARNTFDAAYNMVIVGLMDVFDFAEKHGTRLEL